MSDWSKYYTPSSVADEIVSQIPKEYSPTQVIDICAGKGNLLLAAYKRWPNSDYVCIDIHPNNICKLGNWTNYTLDALDTSLLQSKIADTSGIRLVLANPPFGDNYETECSKNNWVKDFGISAVNRIEADMLISNLFLLRTGDVFGALLPENVFTSERLKDFRNILLGSFEIIHIGKPIKYFKGSEVKTRKFIGIYSGFNFSYGLNDNELKNSNKIKIYRGVENTKLLKDDNMEEGLVEVVHFNNKEGKLLTKRYYPENKLNVNLKINSEDVIVIRVGRNAGSVITPSEKHWNKYISDHLFLVKHSRDLIHDFTAFQKELYKNRKGLTALYITKMDIYHALNNHIQW